MGPDLGEGGMMATPTSSSAMPAVLNNATTIPYWLMDTGSGVDLVSRENIVECDSFVSKNEGITLTTANGELDASDEIGLFIDCIDSHATPLVLDNTPAVLSIGKRSVFHGWGFHWPPFFDHALHDQARHRGTHTHVR